MSGQAFTIADNVVTAINAKGDYSNSLTPGAVRKLLVNTKLNREDITGLLCYAVPGAMVSVPESAQTFEDDYSIRVFVIDKVSKGDDSNDYDETEVKNRLTLVEEIQTQIVTYADTNPATLRFVGTIVNNPILDEEYIDDGVFLSVSELTFRAYREV